MKWGFLTALCLFVLSGYAGPSDQLNNSNASVLTNDAAGAQVIGRPPPGPRPQNQNTWCGLNQFGGQGCGCKGPQRGKGGKCSKLNTQICDCFDRYTNNLPKIPGVRINP